MEQIKTEIVGHLTGGILTDTVTAVLALVFLSLIVLGFEYIRRLLMTPKDEDLLENRTFEDNYGIYEGEEDPHIRR